MSRSPAASIPLPEVLNNIRVGITPDGGGSPGVQRFAPLFFVSPAQINYLVPSGLPNGPASVTVYNGDAAAARGRLQIQTVAPGLFTANASGRGVPAALALRVGPDGSQTSLPVFTGQPGNFVPAPLDLGQETDQVFLLLFGTGFRGIGSNLAAVEARIGGEPAEVLFAGPQGGFAGLDQINLRVPRSLRGHGESAVNLTVSTVPVNPVTISIR